MTFKVTTEDSNNDFVGRNKCKAMELRRDSLKASFESVCVCIHKCVFMFCVQYFNHAYIICSQKECGETKNRDSEKV